MNRLSIKTVGLSVGVIFSVSYVLCVIFDLIFPGWAMYQIWQGLLPGFSWSAAGFLIGLVETVLYGFYVAVIYVPVYNYLRQREAATEADQEQQSTPLAHA
jgi:hypothetical protein